LGWLGHFQRQKGKDGGGTGGIYIKTRRKKIGNRVRDGAAVREGTGATGYSSTKRQNTSQKEKKTKKEKKINDAYVTTGLVQKRRHWEKYENINFKVGPSTRFARKGGDLVKGDVVKSQRPVGRGGGKRKRTAFLKGRRRRSGNWPKIQNSSRLYGGGAEGT